MNRFNVEAAAISHIGSVKASNEDNYYINGKYKSDSTISTDGVADKKKRDSYTYAVCDGMGGENYGELASLIAAATLEKFMKTNIRETVGSYIKTSNDFICDLIRKNKQVKSGTTLALLNMQNGTAISYNIGDSRVYLCRKGELYLLSKDHVDPLIRENLTQYLGILPNEMRLSPYMSEEVKVKKGDVFMLCSVGLTDVLSDEEIVEFLSDDEEDPIAITKKLVSTAQNSHARNDVTVVVIKVT